jgi:hypothetical protein
VDHLLAGADVRRAHDDGPRLRSLSRLLGVGHPLSAGVFVSFLLYTTTVAPIK